VRHLTGDVVDAQSAYVRFIRPRRENLKARCGVEEAPMDEQVVPSRKVVGT
jgi:hypothetical protein